MAKEKKIKDATVSEEKIKKTKKIEKEEIVEEIEEVTEAEEIEDTEGLELDEEVEVEETEKETKKDKKEKNKKADKEDKPKKEKKEKKDGFFKKMFKELKKVVWPKAGEIFKYTMAVLLFCVGLCLFFKGVEVIAALLKELLS